jgi:uncharacterized protein (DUF433 family)
LGGSEFLASEQSYDWLGPGVYFWENDPVRAFDWACLPWRNIKTPSVVGAVIDPGRCLDLTTQEGILAVRSAHKGLAKLHKLPEQPLPRNVGTEKPCIRGLRITVYDVLDYLAGGMTEAQILEDFPALTETDIRACLAYADGNASS